MPTTTISRKEIYHQKEDGTVEVEVIETPIEVPTAEETIAEKEAKLLQMYEELQSLKNGQQD